MEQRHKLVYCSPTLTLNDIIKELRTRDYLTTNKLKEDLKIPKVSFDNEKVRTLKNIVLNRDKYYDLTFLDVIASVKKDM
jgi:hypothetical protein